MIRKGKRIIFVFSKGAAMTKKNYETPYITAVVWFNADVCTVSNDDPASKDFFKQITAS